VRYGFRSGKLRRPSTTPPEGEGTFLTSSAWSYSVVSVARFDRRHERGFPTERTRNVVLGGRIQPRSQRHRQPRRTVRLLDAARPLASGDSFGARPFKALVPASTAYPRVFSAPAAVDAKPVASFGQRHVFEHVLWAERAGGYRSRRSGGCSSFRAILPREQQREPSSRRRPCRPGRVRWGDVDTEWADCG
jgi:hypothetical protein